MSKLKLTYFSLSLLLLTACGSGKESTTESESYKMGSIEMKGQTFQVAKTFDNHIDDFSRQIMPLPQKQVAELFFVKKAKLTYGWTTEEVRPYDYSQDPVESRPPDGGPPPSSSPQFFTNDPVLKKKIEALNKAVSSLIADNDLAENADSYFYTYEMVMHNNAFISILFVFNSCGNRCHEYLRSVNFDLLEGKVLSNTEFIQRLGISPKSFELNVKKNFAGFAVHSYVLDMKYPSFSLLRNNDTIDGEETTYENRYICDFNVLMREASIVPVIYRNDLYLRVAVDIKGYNVTHPGFYDVKWDDLSKNNLST